MSKPMITKEQIEELEAARNRAATRGAWKRPIGHPDFVVDAHDFSVANCMVEEDARFITLAHQHVPALIARVRELEAKYEAAQKAAGLAGNVSIDRNRELIACRKDGE